MAAHVFKVGTLDLSEFLRVNPGDGLDPADSNYFEPSFSESPLREGGNLINEDLNNAERVFPLFLGTRVSATREIVAAHRRAIQGALKEPGCLVEWKEPGASFSTFFDVKAGRLEEDYNQRITEKGRAKANLRVWTKPYGHTATTRGVATAAGSGPFNYVALASIAGDVPARLTGQIGLPSAPMPFTPGRQVGLAVIPHPSYLYRIPAASIILGPEASRISPGTTVRDTQVVTHSDALIGGLKYRLGQGVIPVPSVHEGRNRILALTRGGVPMYLSAARDGKRIGQALATSRGLAFQDLGVLDVECPARQATIVLDLELSPATTALAAGLRGYWMATTTGFQLEGLYIVPDGALVMTQDTGRSPVSWDSFSKSTGSVPLSAYLDSFGNRWAWGTQFGAGSSLYALPDYAEGAAAATNIGNLLLTDPTEDLDMRLRGILANASSALVVGKSIPTSADSRVAVYAEVRRNSLAIGAVPANLGAHVVIASIALGAFTTEPLEVTLRTSKYQMTANVISQASKMVASVGASYAAGAHLGRPIVTSRYGAQLTDFVAAETPSQMAAASALYVFDGVAAQNYKQTSGGVKVTTSNTRGRTPKIAPSSAGVLFLQAIIDEGHGDQHTTANISCRERFSYAR